MIDAAQLTARPLAPADVPAVADLYRRFEDRFFGHVETSSVEVQEGLDLVDDWDAGTVSLWGRPQPVTAAGSPDGGDRGDRLVAVAWLSGQAEGTVLADPASPTTARAAYARLLRWLADAGTATVGLLSRDAAGLDEAAALGWTPHHRSYELFRETGPLPPPTWPVGVEPRDLDLGRDAPQLHRLVYERARWAEVPGHHQRPLEEWRRMIVGSSPRQDLQVVAWDGDAPVGISISVLQAGALGYVGQLAVDRAYQRRGLGRALLLESFRRLVSAGATRLGLEVQAANPGALALYESVGLAVDREWVYLTPA